ncbi:MAG TPA: FAD-dependent oxidoreductase [Polyangia bacterium]|jgi:glycine/D-amino acid oxidase-like deaminating enzyme|nr:FAD-dependent oxidoreductase [Polyangia bacterium]
MRKHELHVVIGGGVAGCLSAITRSRAGYQVVLLEKERARSPGTYPICTQTSNIVSENHSGAEYPFDPQSARDCLDGRIENERFFPETIYGGKTYSRIIASRSMMADGYDIVGQCRRNMEVLRSHYARRCREDASNAVFGPPDPLDGVCREIATVDNVRDVAAAFLTPQRGMNPVFVAAQLEWELRRSGVDFREGSSVTGISHLPDGRYRIGFVNAEGVTEELLADQVSLCSATAAFRMARELNPSLEFPQLYMALREILYVDLPDGTDKNFTCLKLEDAYGGMLSPLNQHCAMIYHPPAAHVMNVVMDPASCRFPAEYTRYLKEGHPEAERRAHWTLGKLRAFYPELARSSILGVYLKIAINTVSDSRVRRNIGVFTVRPGCTMTVLPKWTMCAVNARRELALALAESVARGNMEREEADATPMGLGHAAAARPEPVSSWATREETLTAYARKHAINMRVPEVLAIPFKEAGRSAVPAHTHFTSPTA